MKAREIAAKVAAGKLSALEVTQAALEAIKARDGEIHAFLTVDEPGAVEQARAVDAMRARGDKLPPLAGVPVALKDNLCTAGVRTTCGSRFLEGYIPPYDATVVARLKQSGAVALGKTNMDEFAMGSSTEYSAFGASRNPVDTGRVPGGSSGGSAAAVAAGFAPLALGSDTGGSIRQPAAFCGVVGLKPTYGRVSRYGLVAFASSLDQIGPFAQDVEDAALMYRAIAGADPLDSTCLPDELGDLNLTGSVKGLKVGLPREYFIEGLDPEVKAAVDRAVEGLVANGAEVVEVSLPHTGYNVPVYYLIAPAEASSNLARFDGIRYGRRAAEADGVLETYINSRSEGFGPEVKRRIMLGTYALSSGYYDAYYGKAQQVRTLISKDFARAFEQVDVIVTPTTPTPAFKFNERLSDPLSMYLADLYTIAANLAGLPAMSVPCGKTGAGLPVGLQVIAPPLQERRVFDVGLAVERGV